MYLLDLPQELLALVAQHIGPSELRKSIAYLLVAKRWYYAVLHVYLSQLPLSILYLTSHHDLERFPPPDTALSNLIQTKTKRLSVRLVGHPSKYHSVLPWHDSTDNIDDGDFHLFELDGTKKWTDWYCDWKTAVPKHTAVHTQGKVWHWHRETPTLHQWRACINNKLIELAAILTRSGQLEEFSLEASSEIYDEKGPRWDYLHDITVRSLVSSLPSTVNNLTLDMCGSNVGDSHLCPFLAKRLRDFQNVRLRLRCICPEVFDTSSSTPNTESRLKTLVVRLSLPLFPRAIGEFCEGTADFDAKQCVVSTVPLYRMMIAAGVDFTTHSPGLSMMRVSYRSASCHTHRSDTCLHVADCVRKRDMFWPDVDECGDDEGYRWEAWEDNKILQDGASLDELMPGWL